MWLYFEGADGNYFLLNTQISVKRSYKYFTSVIQQVAEKRIDEQSLDMCSIGTVRDIGCENVTCDLYEKFEGFELSNW